MNRTTCALTAVVLAWAGATGARAQTPTTAPAAAEGRPAPQAAPAGAPAAAAEARGRTAAIDAPAPAPGAFSYDPGGRRDPFLDLRAAGPEPPPPSKRGDGPAGMSSDELSVRGVVRSRGTLIAMIQGPDRKTYVVHPGDTLMDGVVKAIVPEGLVILQDVNDPLSPVRQREIRKLLRTADAAKE
jgi:hypothetical protein